jgi:hypothetical protein
MKMIEIKWDIIDKMPLKVKYYFNDKSIGFDEDGLEKIIQLIKEDAEAEGISFTGRSTSNDAIGVSLEATLPFYKYWETLMSVIGQKKLVLNIT